MQISIEARLEIGKKSDNEFFLSNYLISIRVKALQLQLQKCGSAELQSCRSAEVQSCRSAEVQKCRSAEVQKCRSAEVQKCRSAEVQKCRSAEVQKCRSGKKSWGCWLFRWCFHASVPQSRFRVSRHRIIFFFFFFFFTAMLLYFESQQFLEKDPKNLSVKSRIFESAEAKRIRSNPKQVLAIVSSTKKYLPFLKTIIKNSRILRTKEKVPKKVTENLLCLVVHDLLLTKSGRIQSAKHPIKDFVLQNKSRIHSEYVKLKLKLKVKSLDELVQQDTEDSEDDDYTPVRWFRVNTIKTQSFPKEPFFTQLKKVNTWQEVCGDANIDKIYHDEYIPNLYGINPRAKLSATKAYNEGHVIIQDRSSCFPAHILNPSPGDKVIDACAAPGNKTTHVASYVRNGKNCVAAFERNSARSKILTKMVTKAGAAKCVRVLNKDFTTSKPSDFPDVSGFVVDPSCSGSGIFGRKGESSEADVQDTSRLAKLASFQFTIVRHALLFPSARKLVYSTCSVHAEENEQVVMDLLNDPEVRKHGWRLCDRKDVLPTWERRGFVEEFAKVYGEEEAHKLSGGCVRSLPKVDGGIGFFAAAFEKSVDVEEQTEAAI